MNQSRNSFLPKAQSSNRYQKSITNRQNNFSANLNVQAKYNTISHVSDNESAVANDDDKINNLITKNDRLRLQIRKIEKVLTHQQKQKAQYGVKLPEIRPDVIDRQLQNAYKLIKHYQYEIQKVKGLQKQGTYATRLTKSQRQLKQKVEVKLKLKQQLQKIEKAAKSITKSLTDDHSKILLETKSKKLNDQLKMYEKRCAEDQRKRQFSIQTQKKRKQYIIQLQKKIYQSGIDKAEIQKLKLLVFQNNFDSNKRDDKQEIIQDRSPQAYKSLLSQIKLLRKVTMTNSKLLQKFQLEKEEYVQKNRKSLIRLQQMEKQTQIIQTQINFLKKHMDPQKLKPNIKPPNNPSNTTLKNATFSSGTSSNIQHLGNRSPSILQHHFEFIQIGIATKRSQKYNDRRLLGKRSAKIVGVELYQNRMQLLGLQCLYMVGEDKIQGQLIMIKNQNQRYLQKKVLNLDHNDYFATIQCFVNAKNIVVGVIWTSPTGRLIKCGNLQANKRFLQMNPKEYPGCVYACIAKQGIQLLGVEKIEPQLSF